MPFVTTREILSSAQQGRYAIGAFNVENMEMAQAVIAAAEAMRAPVIVQTTSGTLKHAGPGVFAAMVGRMARDARVPVALHLDHGSSYELAQQCLQEGYTSLMIDGSHMSFDDNVLLTKRVVVLAGDTPVEAELGKVGGKEDDLQADAAYTDPLQAREFVEMTGIFSLAPAIGTAHGVYKAKPRLDIERLSQIKSLVTVPLVLHGTSGVPEDDVKECIRRGICKVNYATELRMVFSGAVKRSIAENPDAFDPKSYLSAGRSAVTSCVEALIRICGSQGKASL